MSKQEEAGLILKLYELRREETMRKARDWFTRSFNPQSIEDVHSAMFSEQSGYFRMVITYWDMTAALVNQGAIGQEMFTAATGEHIGVFAKLEPVLDQCRAAYGPHFLKNLEELIEATPHGRERTAQARSRMKQIVDEYARRQQAAITPA